MAKLPKIPKALPKKPLPPRPLPNSPPYRPHTKPPVEHKVQWIPEPLPREVGPTYEELQAVKKATRVRRWGKTPPLVMGGVTALGIGLWTSQLWISLNREDPALKDLPEDVSDRFDKIADRYDMEVDWTEWSQGISRRRRLLLEKAHGHVLEVAVGTGRNSAYYPTKKCQTITLLDQSGPMLAIAKRKWKDEQPEYFGRAFFKQQSALDPIIPPFDSPGGYDTVIQTMGLCSTPDPVKLLQNLESVTKEDGEILLLEHGKSHYGWLNDILDKSAPGHANKHGCWWNKDIGKIVEESGLEVVTIKRYNFGTTWWVELKPRKSMQRTRVNSGVEELSTQAPESPVTQKSLWAFWR